MSDLIARESSRPDWDGTVIDLIEADNVVGCVFVDDGRLFAEFYADEEGDPWIYDVADLQRVLDTAAAMLEDETASEEESGSEILDPVDRLASVIDATAARRGEEDEGFYPMAVGRRIVAMCEALDLAVASLEGFEVRGGDLTPISGQRAEIAGAHRGEPWALFRAGCNTQAGAVLEKWGSGAADALVAIEVEDRAGEVYVL